MTTAAQPLRIHLASRSPRRRELLHQIGVGFDTLLLRQPPRDALELDETPFRNEEPMAYVQRIARRKAEHGWRIVQWRRLRSQPVLAADTTVDVDGELIGKPTSIDEAERLLKRLSGRTHRVLTAVAVTWEERHLEAISVSEVRFRVVDDDEIARYIATGEAMDKAGGYGIQGRAGMFVAHLAGSYSGVMGLPLCETALLLKRFGWTP